MVNMNTLSLVGNVTLLQYENSDNFFVLLIHF
jgi:hypothetical protein